ncbi:MAG: hypothetical protein R2873_08905 [Caldilineaceae bacterium]|nr:hypothetical protein [Caldilineaceae bacterium]
MNSMKGAIVGLCVVLLTGCHSLIPLIAPLASNAITAPQDNNTAAMQNEMSHADGWGEADLCAPEDIECMLEYGTIVQLTAVCEIPDSDDDCIGTFTYEAWILEPLSNFTAYHEGDGEFVVTLFRDDDTSEVLFAANGVYTSETVTIAPTGIVSMTVQSTGPWHIDVKKIEDPQ